MKTTTLEDLRLDYQNVTGNPFRHFYCPILQRDELAEGCKGHVLNQTFFDSSNKSDERRIWQRADVDSFYGTHFESKFVLVDKVEQIKSG